MSGVDWSMVEKNIGLVFEAANFHANGLYSGDDLVGEAALGCLRASQTLDESKSRFSNYAFMWTANRIARSIQLESEVVQIPANIRLDVKRIGRVRSRLAHEQGRFPSEEEVLDAMGIEGEARNRISDALKAFDAMVERERLGQIDGGRSASQALDEAIRREEAEILQRAMGKLKEIHRESLELRFGLGGHAPHSFEEVARLKGYSYQRAQSVAKVALGSLRRALEEEGMDAL